MTRSVEEPRRIVVVCPNLIGDTVMATPVLRALRERYPSARIVGVMKPAVGPVLEASAWLDERILFAPRSKDRTQRMAGVVARLRGERADWALLLPNSFRSALMCVLAGIPRRIGYARGGRWWLLTDRLRPMRDGKGRYLPVPAVEYYLALARRAGCEDVSVRTELFVTGDERARAAEACGRLGIPDGATIVTLNTGGAFGPAKNWPNGHFVELAKGLTAGDPNLWVVVLCGPAERENARAIAAGAAHPRVLSLAEEPLSLGLSKAMVERSALLITTDSGPRHFAGPLGVPVVTLFGPTHIGWTRTYHPNSLHLQVPVPCGPCQKPVCGEGHHRCMVELTPSSVLAAARTLLVGRGAVNGVVDGSQPERVLIRGPRRVSRVETRRRGL